MRYLSVGVSGAFRARGPSYRLVEHRNAEKEGEA